MRQVFEGPVDVLGVFTGACLRAADGRDHLQLIGALVLVSSGLLPLYDFGVITGVALVPDPLCRKDFGGNEAGSITRRS
jgi:hypothetical protein